MFEMLIYEVIFTIHNHPSILSLALLLDLKCACFHQGRIYLVRCILQCQICISWHCWPIVRSVSKYRAYGTWNIIWIWDVNVNLCCGACISGWFMCLTWRVRCWSARVHTASLCLLNFQALSLSLPSKNADVHIYTAFLENATAKMQLWFVVECLVDLM